MSECPTLKRDGDALVIRIPMKFKKRGQAAAHSLGRAAGVGRVRGEVKPRSDFQKTRFEKQSGPGFHSSHNPWGCTRASGVMAISAST